MHLQDARERYVELKPNSVPDAAMLDAELQRMQRQLGTGDYENKRVPQI